MVGPRVGRSPADPGAFGRRSQASSESLTFVEWLTSNGMYLSTKATWGRALHPLAIADETTDDGEPSGRGLIAVKSLNQGEALFEVPWPLVLTRTRALEHVPGLPEDSDEYIAIAVMLIQERARGSESFWKPYLDILPKDEEMVPLFRWDENDLELLRGSPSLAAARSLRSKLRSEFLSIEETFLKSDRDRFPETVFTNDAWEWAFAVLFSRAIMLQKEGCIALVPYADLLNHNPFCSTYIDMQAELITGDKYVALYTDRPYSKMDQVYVTYGPKSNSELLLLYGFLVDRNPYDAVEITVSPDPDDPLFQQKLEYMMSSGVDESATFPLYGDRYPMELIEFLRFCVSDQSEFESADFGDYVSEQNESLVAQALTDACVAALNGYPQTLDEDKALVADSKLYRLLDVKARCAIRQRLSERRILQRTINTIAKERAEPTFMFAGSTSA
jgi:Rubisco LSMT substrate-binding/SET domain